MHALSSSVEEATPPLPPTILTHTTPLPLAPPTTGPPHSCTPPPPSPPANYQQDQHQLATHEDHLFRERDFASRTHELDEFLDRGWSVLQNLGEQKAMLKNTQRKLYSVANTLGVSRDTIRMVERRVT